MISLTELHWKAGRPANKSPVDFIRVKGIDPNLLTRIRKHPAAGGGTHAPADIATEYAKWVGLNPTQRFQPGDSVVATKTSLSNGYNAGEEFVIAKVDSQGTAWSYTKRGTAFPAYPSHFKLVPPDPVPEEEIARLFPKIQPTQPASNRDREFLTRILQDLKNEIETNDAPPTNWCILYGELKEYLLHN